MPRVHLRQPRFKPDEIVRSWQSFTYDDEQGAHTYRSGVRLRGGRPAILRVPWAFVRDDQPDDDVPSLVPDLPEERPVFRGRTRVRLKAAVLHGSGRFEPGQVVEFPAGTASWVVDEGHGTEA
jgi:hypothetical protein